MLRPAGRDPQEYIKQASIAGKLLPVLAYLL